MSSKIEYEIRQAQLEDINAIISLMIDFYKEAGFHLNIESTEKALQYLISHPENGFIFIAFRDRKPLGHIVLSKRFAMEYEDFIGYVDDLFVQKEFRRARIGNALLDKLCERAKELNLKSLQVEVGENNLPAIKLYEKIGLRAY
ncbi:MAG TPA: GNAT family N-acetyltransferase, partial [Leptospiraceae bacterium]|nr:GNAT family N-acetyltransferase [Leptospiraceae bacterium]